MTQEEEETDSSWKKRNRNKVGNFFKWFRKERMEEEQEEEGRRKDGRMNLSPLLEKRHLESTSSKIKHRSLRNVYSFIVVHILLNLKLLNFFDKN